MAKDLELSPLLDNLDDSIEKDRIYMARDYLKEVEAVDKENELVKTYLEKNKDKIIKLKSNVAKCEELLATMHNEKGWIKAKEKHGVKVFYNKKEGSPLISTLVETFFECDVKEVGDLFVKMVSLFNESDLMPRWFPRGLMKSCDMESQVTKFSKIINNKIKMPMGVSLIIGPREATIFGQGFDMSERSQVVITVSTLKPGDVVEGTTVKPPSKGHTQFYLEAAFFFEMTEKGIDLRIIQHVDMNSSIIPPFIMNMLAKGTLPFEMIENLRNILKKFEGSDWQKRIKDHPEIYNEIKARLDEFIAKKFGNKAETPAADKTAEKAAAEKAADPVAEKAADPVAEKAADPAAAKAEEKAADPAAEKADV